MSRNRSYAQGTTVPTSKTQADILRSLTEFGIKQHGFMTDGIGRSAVVFSFSDLTYRISVLMPKSNHQAFLYTNRGQRRGPAAATAAYDGEVRRRWRSLYLSIKAKLVAIEDDVATFEQEFMPYAVTADGSTVGEVLVPQLKAAAKAGRVPSALTLPGVPTRALEARKDGDNS